MFILMQFDLSPVSGCVYHVQSVPGEIAGTRSQPRVLGVLDEGFVRLFEPVAALVCRTGSQQGEFLNTSWNVHIMHILCIRS